MSSSCQIKNFTQFLEENLKRRVLEYTFKPLTKPGDNYCGVVQSVEVKVAGTNDHDVVNVKAQLNLGSKLN